MRERTRITYERKQGRLLWPRWATFANGRIYRPVMKFMHAHGWCYPTPGLVEPGHVWCHWCGMRGSR
jgi:hypothetical protein